MKRLASSLALAVGVVAVSSCASPDPTTAYGVSAVQFQDVVVPAGMQLRDSAHESHSRVEASWRKAHFIYSGQTPVQSAVSYVRERMPQHNWTMVAEEQVEEAGVKIRFERGIYSAEYVFSRADGATQMVVDYDTQFQRR